MLRTCFVAAFCFSLFGCTADDALGVYCRHHPGDCDGGAGGGSGGGGGAPLGGGTAGGGGPAVGGGTGGGGPDAGTDAGFDAGTDAGFDAGTDAGFRVPDGGWKPLNSSLSGAGIRAFTFEPSTDGGSESRLYAATNAGLFISDNGGVDWREVPEIGVARLFGVALAPGNPNTVYAAAATPVTSPGRDGQFTYTLFTSLDHGATWAKQPVVAGGGTSDYGPPQSLLATQAGNVVIGFSENSRAPGLNLYFVISCSAAGTNNFACGTLALDQEVVSLWLSPPFDVFILSTGGLYRSRGGAAPVLQAAPWNPAPPASFVRGGFTANPDGGLPFVLVIHTATYNSEVYEFSAAPDGGLVWNMMTAAPPNTFSVTAAPDGTFYAAGLFGPATWGVKNSPSPHTNWTAFPTPPKRNPYSSLGGMMYLPVKNSLWIGGAPPPLQEKTSWNDGPWEYDTGWVTRSSGMCTNSAWSLAVDPVDPAFAYAVIRSWAVYEFSYSLIGTDNGGQTWFDVPPPSNTFIEHLAVDPFDGQHLLSSFSSSSWLYETTNTAVTWGHAVETASVLDVKFDPAHQGVRGVVLQGTPGFVVETFDGGPPRATLPVNGTLLTSFTFPRDGGLPGDAIAAVGTTVWFLSDGGVNASSQASTRPCMALASSSPAFVTCVQDDGRIFRTEGVANAWSPDTSLHFRGAWIDEADGVSVWAGTTDEGIHLRRQGSWEDRSPGLPLDGGVGVSSFAQQRANPNVIYLSTEGRGLFRTDTAGQ